MDKEDILGYLELLLRHDLIFEDKELMQMINHHIERNFHQFELGEIFKLVRIIAHNFYRDPVTIALLEDAVRVRMSDKEQYLNSRVSAYDLRDLIEGLSFLSKF